MRFSDCALHAEHVMLGATAAGDGLAVPVLSYGNADAEAASGGSATVIADVSGMFVQLVTGVPAQDYVAAAFARAPLAPGDCGFSAVLTGDGAIAGMPLLARTGICEYVALDVTSRSEVLAAWLSFLVSVRQDGRAPYAGVRLEDATDVHVPLLLAGADSGAVLADYVVGGMRGLPDSGRIDRLTLDGRMEVLCARFDPVKDAPCYLLLVSPSHARVLWRSLLSFPSVVPVGRTAILRAAHSLLPWFGDVSGSPDRLVVSGAVLEAYGLMRKGGGFVGARALDAVENER